MPTDADLQDRRDFPDLVFLPKNWTHDEVQQYRNLTTLGKRTYSSLTCGGIVSIYPVLPILMGALQSEAEGQNGSHFDISIKWKAPGV